jgi:hypothetical protein
MNTTTPTSAPTPDDIKRQCKHIVDAFVAHSYCNSCLPSAALLQESTGVGELIYGFQVFETDRYYARHCWYRHNNVDYDVGQLIRFAYAASQADKQTHENLCHLSSQRRLADKIPEGDYVDCDSTDAENRENAALFEAAVLLYQSSQKRYWKQAPGWMRRQRTRFIHETKAIVTLRTKREAEEAAAQVREHNAVRNRKKREAKKRLKTERPTAARPSPVQ